MAWDALKIRRWGAQRPELTRHAWGVRADGRWQSLCKIILPPGQQPGAETGARDCQTCRAHWERPSGYSPRIGAVLKGIDYEPVRGGWRRREP